MKAVHPWVRNVFLTGCLLSLIAGVQLFVFSTRTELYFAWTIQSALTAATLGAFYFGAMTFGGDDHAACFLAGDNIGGRIEGLVAPDVVVVPVAVDGGGHGAAEQGFGCGTQVRASPRRAQRVKHQRAVTQVNYARVADGRATVDVDCRIDTFCQLL